MKKDLKTQKFICAVKGPADSNANVGAGCAAKVRTHVKEAPKNLASHRQSCNPILGQTRPAETFGWWGAPKRQRLSGNDTAVKGLMSHRNTQPTQVSGASRAPKTSRASGIPRISVKSAVNQ